MHQGDGDPNRSPQEGFSFSQFIDGVDEDWGDKTDFSFDTGWDRQKDPWSLDLDDPEHEEVDDDDLGDDSLGASDIAADDLDDDSDDGLADDLEENLDDHLRAEDEDDDDDWG